MKIKNAAGQAADVRTFHEHGRAHGAVEVRCTVLLPLLTYTEEYSNSVYQIIVDSPEKRGLYTFEAQVAGPSEKEIEAAKAEAHRKMNAANLQWSKRVDVFLFDVSEDVAHLTVADLLRIAADDRDKEGKHRDPHRIEISSHNLADFTGKAASEEADKQV